MEPKAMFPRSVSPFPGVIYLQSSMLVFGSVIPWVVKHHGKTTRVTFNTWFIRARSTVPEGYERAIDHFEFDLTGKGEVWGNDSVVNFGYIFFVRYGVIQYHVRIYQEAFDISFI